MGNALIYRKRKNTIEKIVDHNKIPFHSYEKEEDVCKVTKCYDGDTIHILRIIGKTPYRFKCRLTGIDTAEIRTNNSKEKVFALKTRDYLANLILDKFVWVVFGGFDKYGRLLCEVYLDHRDIKRSCSVNKQLINEGYAQPYDGGTKFDFKDWNFNTDNGLLMPSE